MRKRSLQSSLVTGRPFDIWKSNPRLKDNLPLNVKMSSPSFEYGRSEMARGITGSPGLAGFVWSTNVENIDIVKMK